MAPGGILVYSTCSIDFEENHGPVSENADWPYDAEECKLACLMFTGLGCCNSQVNRLLKSQDSGPAFRPLQVSFEGPTTGRLCSNGPLETFPHLHGVDGAFAAKLQRVK